MGPRSWAKLYEVYNDIANRLLSPSLRPGDFPGVLRRGDSGTPVRELQFYLYLLSAYDSSIPGVDIDGQFGAATEAAVRAYQRSAGLAVDGIVGRSTWDALYRRASGLRSSGPVVKLKRLPYPGTALTVGSRGEAVLYYSLLLQRIAYYFDTVETPPLSSVYTPDTAATTSSFQTLLGLAPTGTADQETWTAAEGLSLQLAAFSGTESQSYPGRGCGLGSAGAPTAQVERWLNRRSAGYCGEDFVSEDRWFGTEDAAAVQEAQRRAGLAPTGTVDRETWAALCAQSRLCGGEKEAAAWHDC